MKKKSILFIITQHNFFLAYFIFQEKVKRYSVSWVLHECVWSCLRKDPWQNATDSKTWGWCPGQNGFLQNDTQVFCHHWCDETVYCLCARKPTLNSGEWQRLLLNFLISSAHTSDRRFVGYVTLTFPRPRLALVLQRRYRNQHEWGRMVAQRVYQVVMFCWQCGNTGHPHQIRWMHSQIWYRQV